MPSKVVITAIVSVLVQFGLAVCGWGGLASYLAHPALRALIWVSVALLAVSFFSGGGVSSGEREDRANRWVLAVFGVLALALAYFSAYTDRIGFLTLDHDTARWIGVGVVVVGGGLRLAPVFVLRNRFSGLVAIQPDHRLETHGLYSVVRNPSYLGLLISSIGWALAFRSIVGIAIGVAFLVPLVARMHAEERLLREHFGAEYDAYFARTWRLVPWIY